MSKNLPLKLALVGAFFVASVGVANAASYRGGLLVTRPTPTPKPVVRLQIKNFLAGIDQVFATAGRFIIGFFDGLMPQAKPVAQKPVATPRAIGSTGSTGVILGVEDDIAELGSRVAVLEGKDTGGDTSVSLGTLAIQGDNLVRNSSFEVSDSNDTPRYWSYQLDSSYGNTFKSAEGIRSGKYGLKFLGGSHGGLGVSQPDTKLEAGRSYVLSLYVKAVNVGAATLSFGFWDEVANARGTMKSVSYAGTKDWHRVSLVVEHAALSDKGKKWFPLIEVNNLGQGNIYIDDVQLSEGSVLSSYNSDLGDDAGQILGGGAVLVDNNGNVFPAKDGIGELGLSGAKFKALTLSKASIDKDGNTTIDGATTLKGGVTLGDETSDTITFNGTVAGFTLTGSATYNDDVKLSFGTGGPADILWETADANANELIVAFDEGGSVDVPVLVVGDASIDNVDLGMFNGVTSPSVAVISDDAGDYVRLYVTDAGVSTLLSGTGDIALMPDADTGDYVTLSSDGTDLTLATTDAAALAINPAGAISIDSGGTFTISDAVDLNNTLDLDTTGAVSLNTSQGAANAIELIASAGGIDISTGGDTQDIDILSGDALNLTSAKNNAAAVVITASAGGIDILASAAAAGEDIDVIATGSSVNLQSTEGVANAITLVSTSGGIDLSTGGDAAANDIDLLSGSSINLTAAESAADSIVLTSSAGGIDILATGAAAGEDIDITATGSSVNLSSTEGVANAITLVSSTGGIDISTGTGTAGNDIDILSGVSINLRAYENVTDAIVLNADNGGIDISTGGQAGVGNDIDLLSGASINLTAKESVADSIVLSSSAGGIDISTGGDTQDIDILSGDALNLTSAKNNAAAVVITASAGGVDILASAAAAGEDIDITATGSSVNLSSTEGVANAITIVASAGGIDISTGSGTQDIDILGGASINLTAAESAADSIVLTSSAGGIDILATGAAAGEDIDVTATGSSVNLSSTESVADSITLISGTGGIDISTGGDTQDIDILSGDALNLTSAKNNAAAVVITASAGGVDILASAAAAGEDIDITATGSSVNLSSTEGVANAITLVSTSGGIDLSTGGDAAANDIDLLSGSSINLTAAESAADSIVLTSSAGGIDILATGAAAGEDIDITATGSSVNLSSTEGATDAITIVASAGGIDISTGSGTADIDILGGDAIVIKAVGGAISMSAGTSTAGSGLTIESGGQVGIGLSNPAHAIDVIGTAGLSTGTAWTNTSDIRFKNIESELYGGSLDLVMALHPVTFTWNELHASKYGGDPGVNYGFIAQEVAQVIPEFITQNDEGYYLYNPSGIEAVLTASIQEQQGQITYLYDSLGLTYVAPAEAGAAAVTEEVVTQEVSGEVLAQTDAAEVAQDDLVVKMAATFEGTLVVKGAATFEGVLTVNGVAVVQELDVAGAITQTFTAAQDLNPGDMVAIVGENSVGKGSPVVGVVASSATAGGSVKVAIAGTVGGFSGLTPGQVVYAGEQAIGVARSATSVLVMPNLPSQTVEPVASPIPPEPTPTPTPTPIPVDLPNAPEGTPSGTP